MSWNNYGTAWHLDHIKSINAFNLFDVIQQQQCFHYTNIQPLWATSSIAKQHGDMYSVGNLEKHTHYV